MAYLQVETEVDVRRVTLVRERLTMGRLPANDIVIPNQQVSRFHAELRSSPEGWWIADLDSTNGIQMDGRRVERHLLRAGERVQLAPGVFVVLVVENGADDISAQATAYVPSLAAERALPGEASGYGSSGAQARAWLPPRSATAWGASSAEARDATGSIDRSAPVEGDLFRRKRSRLSSGPSTDVPLSARSPMLGAAAAHLHLCQTCGQQTAPDAMLCRSCGSSIAQECRACRLSLLPIQDVCPRCQTPNPASVVRTRHTPA